jgi:hypothetical protein
LPRHASRSGSRILEYGLITNYIYLVAVPGTGNSLARTLDRTRSMHALVLNQRWGSSGHVWQGRFSPARWTRPYLLGTMHYVD